MAETKGWGRTVGMVLLALMTLGIAALALSALALPAITAVAALQRSPSQGPSTKTRTLPPGHRSDANGPGADKAPPPRDKARPRPPIASAWPTGPRSSDLALIATNIPPGAPHKSTTLLLDVKSDRYVLLSQGDQLGEFEVVRIAMDWVQLRRADSYSWVSYRKGEKRRARARGPKTENRSPPPRVRRRSKAPSVTLKWIVGRLNLAGELEDHLRPTVTAKGLKVGRVTSGFRRIGLQVGDVVQRSGDFPVHSLEQLRNGMQRAAHSGGSGSITVLRKGRSVQLSFGVR